MSDVHQSQPLADPNLQGISMCSKTALSDGRRCGAGPKASLRGWSEGLVRGLVRGRLGILSSGLCNICKRIQIDVRFRHHALVAEGYCLPADIGKEAKPRAHGDVHCHRKRAGRLLEPHEHEIK